MEALQRPAAKITLSRSPLRSLYDHADYLIKQRRDSIANGEPLDVRIGLSEHESFETGLIHYLIVLNLKGEAVAWTTLTREVVIKKKPTTLIGILFDLPQTPRSNDITPKLGYDNPQYVFADQKRVAAFKKRIGEIAARVTADGLSIPLLDAVSRFYDGPWEGFAQTFGAEIIADAEARKLGDNEANITFSLEGLDENLLEITELQPYLIQRHFDDETLEEGTCLITGRKGPLLRSSPIIKGVPGAQASGARLISYTINRGQNYGLTQEQMYPPHGVDTTNAFRALNHILRQSSTIKTKNLTVCHYTDGVTVNPLDVLRPIYRDLSHDEIAELESVVLSPKSGLTKFDPSARITILGLRPEMARIVIDHHDDMGTEDIVGRLRRWHDDLAIDDPSQDAGILPLFKILSALQGRLETGVILAEWPKARRKANEQQLYLAAVFEQKIPGIFETALYEAWRRFAKLQIRSKPTWINEQRHILASFGKLILIRNYGVTVSPNLEPNPQESLATRLGRAYALYAIIHEMNYPERIGLVSGQMGAAMLNPVSALDFAKFHAILGMRLRSKDHRGFAFKVKRRWEAVIAGIDDMRCPRTPTAPLEFSVGYEKERQLYFTKSVKETEAEEEAVA